MFSRIKKFIQQQSKHRITNNKKRTISENLVTADNNFERGSLEANVDDGTESESSEVEMRASASISSSGCRVHIKKKKKSF